MKLAAIQEAAEMEERKRAFIATCGASGRRQRVGTKTGEDGGAEFSRSPAASIIARSPASSILFPTSTPPSIALDRSGRRPSMSLSMVPGAHAPLGLHPPPAKPDSSAVKGGENRRGSVIPATLKR